MQRLNPRLGHAKPPFFLEPPDMSMNRREFLQILAAASAAGFALDSRLSLLAAKGGPRRSTMCRASATCTAALHRLPRPAAADPFPRAEREPRHRRRHRQGRRTWSASTCSRPSTSSRAAIEAHAFTYLDFAEAAKTYGKVGGFAHLATLVKRLRAGRPGALLLDGGDTWQGSATALWSKGQDMVDACKLLGVDIMTGTGNSPSAPSASGDRREGFRRQASSSSPRT
jgi:sulfur-oxidizing protein SoxB